MTCYFKNKSLVKRNQTTAFSKEFPVLAKEHIRHFELDVLGGIIEIHTGEFQCMVPHFNKTWFAIEQLQTFLVKEESSAKPAGGQEAGLAQPVQVQTDDGNTAVPADDLKDLGRRLHLLLLCKEVALLAFCDQDSDSKLTTTQNSKQK